MAWQTFWTHTIVHVYHHVHQQRTRLLKVLVRICCRYSTTRVTLQMMFLKTTSFWHLTVKSIDAFVVKSKMGRFLWSLEWFVSALAFHLSEQRRPFIISFSSGSNSTLSERLFCEKIQLLWMLLNHFMQSMEKFTWLKSPKCIDFIVDLTFFE